MSAPLSKSLGLSSAPMVSNKQGIVSILGSDSERPTKAAAASLRRTLSADMSSKKWLSQHGFSPLKKIASSERFPVSIIDSSSEDDDSDEERKESSEARGQFDSWASIQREKEEQQQQPAGQFDIWSSIISQKAREQECSQPPYIHPLVKRSASCLSEKSLEICTESLGSETGSDGFSSYPPSESGDMEQEEMSKEEDQEVVQHPKEDRINSLEEEPIRIAKYNYDVGKKLGNRSFPPPIPSLSLKDGASVRMKTHRDNGRLVLEAVSVHSPNNFLAQRQDGRLVLTFANTTLSSEAEYYSKDNQEINVEEELEEEFDSFGISEDQEKESEIGEEEEEEEEERCCVMEEQAPKLPNGAMNVHRLAVMMNKPIWLENRNPTRPKNFDEIVKFGEEREGMKEVEPTTPALAQSLPPRPRVARLIPTPPSTTAAAAASFNAYEYYWRPNQPMSKAAAATAVLNPFAQQSAPPLTKNPMANDQQQLLVLGGNKVDYFGPLLKGCKEPRRSLRFWEPYCIATS